MRAHALVVLALFAFVCPPARAAEPPPPCCIDKFYECLGVKIKLTAVAEGIGALKTVTKDVQLTLEFTADTADVTALRAALAPAAADPGTRAVVHLFDADNVPFAKAFVASQEGEITGKKCEAFRVTVQIDPAVYAKVKRIALQPPALSRAPAEPPQDVAPPCNVDHLESTWHLEVRSAVVKNVIGVVRTDTKAVRLTLAFTADAADVRAVRPAFVPGALAAGADPDTRVLFCLFDEEGVLFRSAFITSQEGQITGKKGDAFRVTLQIDPATLARTKRVELRPAGPPKEVPLVFSVGTLDRAWNLKIKSAHVADVPGIIKDDATAVRLTLEFTADTADVAALRAALEPATADPDPRVVFYLFDGENVPYTKSLIASGEGDIMGRLGDAFRLTARFDPKTFARAKRVELRLVTVMK
ncbi:MAG TPA: hypothetical protein VGE74_10045 [Gemmata sp.]